MLTNLELIRRVPLFSMLTREQATLIAGAVVKRRFKRGEAIVERGKKTNALFILLNGRANVVIAAQGKKREVILAALQPGSYIGEMSLIDNGPHSATVRAEVQTDVLMLDGAEFARCLPENSTMVYTVMRGLVQRLRQADCKIESLALMDVYGRVARALLELAGAGGQGQRLIHDRISRQDIAKSIGASREMVSRVMKDLERRGLIQTQGDGSLLIQEQLDVLE